MTRSAEHGSMAEVGSPVDIAPDPVDQAQPWVWTSQVIGVATLVLLVLNAHAIAGWFAEQPPSTLTERLAAPIDGWTGATERAGLDVPRAAMRGRWEDVKAKRFGAEQPGEQGAPDAG